MIQGLVQLQVVLCQIPEFVEDLDQIPCWLGLDSILDKRPIEASRCSASSRSGLREAPGVEELPAVVLQAAKKRERPGAYEEADRGWWLR